MNTCLHNIRRHTCTSTLSYLSYIRVCVCIYMHIFIDTHKRTDMYVCMYVYMYVCNTCASKLMPPS